MSDKAIQLHYDEAVRLALTTVERMARKILRDHPNLDEFVMGMGRAMFTTNDKQNLGTEERAYMRPLDDFLTEWDRWLHLTGEPMRFTAHGPKITTW